MPTSTPFANLITFSRGSNATVVGPNGLVQWAPNNLLTFSEQVDNAAWSKVNLTVSANTSTAPDGTRTADKLIPSTSSNNKAALGAPNTTFSAGQGATHSCYAKADGYSKIALRESATTGAYASFDLAAGTLIETGNAGGIVVSNASITAVGNGWYRLAMTCTNASTSTVNGFGAWPLSPSYTTGQPSSLNWSGDGTSGILVWGAQLELGTAATTYNPTSVKNLLGFSEAFDNAAWTKLDTSIVTGAQANPVNGLFNAQKLMENTANAQHIVQQGFSVTSGTPYVFSVYAKAAGRNRFSLRLGSIAPADIVTFDLSNGTIVTGSVGYVASITSIDNGWYRCSITSTPASSGTRQHQIYLNSGSGSGAESYTGDGNSGVFIYGAQLSDSASLDPYVPTPGAAPSSTAYYGPRFDYDPVTRAARGILIEEQRTNLLVQSEDFTTTWAASGASPTANTTTSPSGAVDADSLIEDSAAASNHRTSQTVSVTSGTTYTFSVFVKRNGRNFVQLFFSSADFGANAWANFDLNTGVLGDKGSAATSTITSFGNGWYRCTMSAPATATNASALALIQMVTSATAARSETYNGDGTSGIFLYGAQLEAGAFATSYIPTIASTVTRSADVATITGQNFGQWYAQNVGTVVADFRTLLGTSPTGTVFGGGSQVFQARIEGGSARSSIRGVVDLITSTGPSVTMPGSNKVASAYLSGDSAISANSSAAVTSSTTFTSSGGTLTALGSDGLSNNNYINGWLRNITYIPVRAANFQLQALSTQTIADYFYLQTATGDQLVDGNGDSLYSVPIYE